MDPPWRCEFVVDAFDDLVDEERLTCWLEGGGLRIGIGDWRPASCGSSSCGSSGTFHLVGVGIEG